MSLRQVFFTCEHEWMVASRVYLPIHPISVLRTRVGRAWNDTTWSCLIESLSSSFCTNQIGRQERGPTETVGGPPGHALSFGVDQPRTHTDRISSLRTGKLRIVL